MREVPIEARPLIDFPGHSEKEMPYVPPADIAFDVWEHEVKDRSSGSVRTVGKFGLAEFLKVEAKKARQTNSRVAALLHGKLTGVDIGHDNSGKGNDAWWGKGTAVSGIDLIGDRDARVSYTTLGDDKGGWDDIYFRGVDFVNQKGTNCNIIVFAGTDGGRLGIYDGLFTSEDPSAYNKTGKKWWVRGHGVASYDVRDTKGDSCQEHPFYVDRPGYHDGRDSLFEYQMLEGHYAGRTPFQCDTRTKKTYKGQPLYGGDPSMQKVFLRGIKANVDRRIGGGGSGITFAGHGGPVVVDGCTIGGNTGMFVSWTDISKGAALCWRGEHIGNYSSVPSEGAPPGYSHTQVWVRGLRWGGNDTGIPCDRPAMAVSGCEMAAILGCDAGDHDKPFLQLHNAYGGPIGNRFAFVGRQLHQDGDVIKL